MPKSLPDEAASELLRRQRKDAMQSSTMATGRDNHRRNGDRGNDDDGDRAAPQILVPDPQVWKEFGVSSMTLFRWSRNPKLNFPPAVKINGRNFRSRRLIEDFKARLLREAISNYAA